MITEGPEPGPDRILWLDGWRGSALLFVLASHFGGPEYLGRFGVDAFFVLSGILMAKLLYLRQQPLSAFFARRAARILPAFLVYTGVVYAAEAWLTGGSTALEILSTLVFARTYVPSDSDRWITELPLAHLWSLNVEEHSYVFLALTAAALARQRARGARLLLGSALVSVAFYLLYRYAAPPSTAMPYAVRTECAAFPLLLAAGLHLRASVGGPVRSGWRQHPATVMLLPCLSLGLVAGFHDKMMVTHLLSPALLALAIHGMLQTGPGPRLAALLSWRPLRLLGTASFSLYLWQQPAHFLIRNQHVDWSHGQGLLISLVLGALSFLCIEQPARRWLVRAFHADRPT